MKANTPRGWVMLVNDANLARNMLVQQSNAGRGNVPMHVGKYWSDGASARATIDQVLADPDVMASSAEAVHEVDAQVTKLKAETGLTDAEIIRIPFHHRNMGEVHCGTNSTRRIPSAKWWESGR